MPELPLGEPDAVDIASLKVISIPDNGRNPVSDDLRQAQRRCLQALEQQGATVAETSVKLLKDSFGIWSTLLHEAGGRSFRDMLQNGTPSPLWKAFAKYTLRRSPHTFPAIVLAAMELLSDVSETRRTRLIERAERLCGEINDLLGENGILLYPSYTRPAPRHHQPLLHPFDWVYTAIVNVMELPATQVPLGLNGHGLPLGVQVIGSHGADHRTIAVAMALERHFGVGRRPGKNREPRRDSVFVRG